MDVDSDGVKIDFNDRETYECLYREYWNIIKEKEGWTIHHVLSADNLVKKGENYKGTPEVDIFGEVEDDTDEFDEESDLIISDYDDLEDEEGHKPVGKRRKTGEKRHVLRKKVELKKHEFTGWGTKVLLEFLEFIGKDTSNEISQYDVTSIITDYCKEKKLFHPEKRKKIICDASLHSLFRRRSVYRNSIYKLLTTHFTVNMEESSQSVDDRSEKGENAMHPCKRHKNMSSFRKSQKVELDSDEGLFASIVAENIKLIYLKRSLVEELSKNQESFDGKVIGSFVRVKADWNDFSQKNSHQLLQVTGTKRIQRNDNANTELFLEVSNAKDVPIFELSDDDFSKEECEDLRQRVKDGLIKRQTVGELEKKARNLHEDITKHRIATELAILQKCIDHANEKGWRRELFEFIESRQLLQTPSQQSKLLREILKVVADIPDVETNLNSSSKDEQIHNGLHESTSEVVHQNPNDIEENGSCFYSNDTAIAPNEERLMGSPIPKKKLLSEVYDLEEQRLEKSDQSLPPALPNCNIHSDQQRQSLFQVGQICSKSLPIEVSTTRFPALASKADVTIRKKRRDDACVLETKVIKSKSESEIELIYLSGDDEDGKDDCEKQILKSQQTNSLWYCASPYGEIRGPLPMSLLKQWKDSISYDLKFKVWKTGQTREQAVLLSDAIP